jgi:hypothetical protein
MDDRLVMLVWTPRGNARLVISVRKANGREVKTITPAHESL